MVDKVSLKIEIKYVVLWLGRDSRGRFRANVSDLYRS